MLVCRLVLTVAACVKGADHSVRNPTIGFYWISALEIAYALTGWAYMAYTFGITLYIATHAFFVYI